MSTVRCPLCNESMDSGAYTEHMSWTHPDFHRDWFPAKELPANPTPKPKDQTEKK